MKAVSIDLVRRIQCLRKRSLSHRNIARVCKVGLGTAYKYTLHIKPSREQHLKLKIGTLTGIRRTPTPLLREGWRRGGLNTSSHFKSKYTRAGLIVRIRDFYIASGRIPTKREFNSQWQCYRKHFGSWNKAIEAAGYRTNPVLFARKCFAKDGHHCDSLSEKIIDDWLYQRSIPHERSIYYPGQRKFTADFLAADKYWIEFLGLLDGPRSYRGLLLRKEALARKAKIRIIKIYPNDLFPLTGLEGKLRVLTARSSVIGQDR